MAAVADQSVTALPSLDDSVDPDALEALFPESATDGSVAFAYGGYLVVVTAGGIVEVYDEETPS